MFVLQVVLIQSNFYLHLNYIFAVVLLYVQFKHQWIFIYTFTYLYIFIFSYSELQDYISYFIYNCNENKVELRFCLSQSLQSVLKINSDKFSHFLISNDLYDNRVIKRGDREKMMCVYITFPFLSPCRVWPSSCLKHQLGCHQRLQEADLVYYLKPEHRGSNFKTKVSCRKITQ